MDQLYGIGQAAALPGVHPATCRRRERQGKIQVLRTLGGKRRISESEIRHLRGESLALLQRVLAIYGRVSSREQKARGNPDRQVARIRAAMVGQGVAVTYRDRLMR